MKWQTHTPVPYSSLSYVQRASTFNGCGAQNSTFRPPHSDLFEEVCWFHDFGYTVGGSFWAKLKVDWRLRRGLREKIRTTDILVLRNNLYMDDHLLPEWAVRQVYYRWADAYYAGVVVGGNSSFRFAKKKQWPDLGW